MVTEEKFNQIYQKIVNENVDNMEVARKEAQMEQKHNMFILIVIILINVAFYGFQKLINNFSLGGILIFISLIIYMKIKRKGKREQYTMDFKTRIVGTMIKSFEEQLEIMPQYRIILNSI